MVIPAVPKDTPSSGFPEPDDFSADVIVHPRYGDYALNRNRDLIQRLALHRQTALQSLRKALAELDERQAESVSKSDEYLRLELQRLLDEVEHLDVETLPDPAIFHNLGKRLELAAITSMYKYVSNTIGQLSADLADLHAPMEGQNLLPGGH